MTDRAMRRRDRQTKRRVWFHRRGRFGYPHMRAAWPAIVPGAGVRGWRAFHAPINACRWIAAATCPQRGGRNQSRIMAGVKWLVWHCWAVLLGVVAIALAAVGVVVVGFGKGAVTGFCRVRTHVGGAGNQPPPPPPLVTAAVIDPGLDAEMSVVFRAVEAEYSGAQDCGARESGGFVFDEAGELLDPADRTRFDQAQRSREAAVRSVEMDRVEADRKAHSALLDRIEALQPVFEHRPVGNQNLEPVFVEVDDGSWLGPFIAAVALVVFAGYGIVAVGFVGWASSRLDDAQPVAQRVEVGHVID